MRRRWLATLLFTFALPVSVLADLQSQSPISTVEGGSAGVIVSSRTPHGSDGSDEEIETFIRNLGLGAAVVLVVVSVGLWLGRESFFRASWE